MKQDLRWEQRFTNFDKALRKLSEAVNYIRQNQSKNENSTAENDFVLDEMIKEGLIQRFEYTHELAWNVMKDYAEYQGNSEVGGSRDSTREAFQIKLISNGKVWMVMIDSRNKTSHTYNEKTADEIYHKIMEEYYQAFLEFHKTMKAKKSGEQSQLL